MTPGPWQWGENAVDGWFTIFRSGLVYDEIGVVETEADARAIACVPDMLALLREMQNDKITKWSLRIDDLLARIDEGVTDGST